MFEKSSDKRNLIPYDEVSFTIVILSFAISAFLSLVFLAASLVKLRSKISKKDHMKNKLCRRLIKSSFQPLKLVFILKKTNCNSYSVLKHILKPINNILIKQNTVIKICTSCYNKHTNMGIILSLEY